MASIMDIIANILRPVCPFLPPAQLSPRNVTVMREKMLLKTIMLITEHCKRLFSCDNAGDVASLDRVFTTDFTSHITMTISMITEIPETHVYKITYSYEKL